MSQWTSSAIFSQDSIRCSSVKKFTVEKKVRHQTISQGCSTTSHGDARDNDKECELNAQLVSLLARRFGTRQWSFVDPGFEKKSGILSVKSVHKVNGTNDGKDIGDTCRMRTPSLPSHESIVQRSAEKQRRW